MGLSCKGVGKFRSMMDKIKREELERKEKMKKNEATRPQKKNR